MVLLQGCSMCLSQILFCFFWFAIGGLLRQLPSGAVCRMCSLKTHIGWSQIKVNRHLHESVYILEGTGSIICMANQMGIFLFRHERAHPSFVTWYAQTKLCFSRCDLTAVLLSLSTEYPTFSSMPMCCVHIDRPFSFQFPNICVQAIHKSSYKCYYNISVLRNPWVRRVNPASLPPSSAPDYLFRAQCCARHTG